MTVKSKGKSALAAISTQDRGIGLCVSVKGRYCSQAWEPSRDPFNKLLGPSYTIDIVILGVRNKV